MPDPTIMDSDMDWWTEQRRRQGTIGQTPTTIANTRDPLRSFRGVQRAFPGDVDVEQAYRMAEEQRSGKPMMRAIVDGKEYQMESKGRTVREDEALKMIESMQRKRMADEGMASKRAAEQAALEDQRAASLREQQKFELAKQAGEMEIAQRKQAMTREQAQFDRASQRDQALQETIESGRFNDLGVSAQGGARIANAYRTGGIEAAKAALAREQQQQDQPSQDIMEIARTLAAQGKWREAQALAASAGVPSAIGAAGAVLGPMEEAKRRAEAEATRVGQQLRGFGSRDTAMFQSDPGEAEMAQRAKEIEALASLYEQAGMTPEEARAKANEIALQSLGSAADSMRGGWSQALLQRIGAY